MRALGAHVVAIVVGILAGVVRVLASVKISHFVKILYIVVSLFQVYQSLCGFDGPWYVARVFKILATVFQVMRVYEAIYRFFRP